MTYKLTVNVIRDNAKTVTDFPTFSAARKAARLVCDRTDHAADTAVKIRDANGALLFHEICEGPAFQRAATGNGKWYVRVFNVTRGKFVGKRFASEAKARAHFEAAQSETRDYDTAYILRSPSGDLMDYKLIYGEADQLETRPPNRAN